ncbi:ribonuclease III [Ferriphaselus sp. R-1]|uniref:ribonuclease III n=1 Tax=Ferriphaselus sp. R-1 TaxID=1485544 RepID=UPI0005591080|nr:ribonuclease III [Ferriphaselus sp. R-1]
MSRTALCQRLGYSFTQPALLGRALTHRSYGVEHNERLEFLGDSVLNCVIASYLYESFQHLPEGDLSRLRSNLVNQQTLFVLAQQQGLGELLRLGEGERKSAGFRRPSILADALEALFGAIFLDGGFDAARKVVLGLYEPFIASVDIQTLGKDSKTLLQEHLQSRRLSLPRYTVSAIEGEAHAQLFRVECRIDALGVATKGEGSSRRNAEQQAAEAALLQLTRK